MSQKNVEMQNYRVKNVRKLCFHVNEKKGEKISEQFTVISAQPLSEIGPPTFFYLPSCCVALCTIFRLSMEMRVNIFFMQ